MPSRRSDRRRRGSVFRRHRRHSIADAILEGRCFSDILNSLTKQLFRAGLQGAFTGQGPLAGLLGTAPSASSATRSAASRDC